MPPWVGPRRLSDGVGGVKLERGTKRANLSSARVVLKKEVGANGEHSCATDGFVHCVLHSCRSVCGARSLNKNSGSSGSQHFFRSMNSI